MNRRRSDWAIRLGAVCALAPSCSPEAEPRAQLVVVIDTDAPVVGQLADHAELSADGALDMLRIEVLDDNGVVTESMPVPAPDPRDWPVSFGMATGARGGHLVHLRVRAFRSKFAGRGERAALAFASNLVIDRLLDLALPASGVRVARVLLAGDCLGVSALLPTALHPAATCVAAGKRLAASDGITWSTSLEGAPPSSCGTWDKAIEKPCTLPLPHDALCISGGIATLGDTALSGFSDGITQFDPVPLRPVALRPYYLDRTEFTVGRYRSLVLAGKLAPPVRPPLVTFPEACTWLGPDDGANDAYALNCVSEANARAACIVEGGDLPSEAQWEFAARGRGKRSRFPWGDAEPTCCTASYDRGEDTMARAECPGGLHPMEKVGAHQGPAGCADISRDGVLDLGGSVQELVRDNFEPYDHACWGDGIALDRVCENPKSARMSARGASWHSPALFVASALRFVYTPGAASGFRCAYEGSPR